jgi:hypothetical protein
MVLTTFIINALGEALPARAADGRQVSEVFLGSVYPARSFLATEVDQSR